MSSGYTFGAVVAQPIDLARARVEAALREEGFGILTEIDVAATLKAKLGLDRPPYLILGACNPGLANRAIEVDPSIGALLPCNVVLRQPDDGSGTIVEIMDPVRALSLTTAAGVAPIATEAAERLHRVLDTVVAA